MKLEEAKELVLNLIQAELIASGSTSVVDPSSPDGDEGKFTINGKPARTILPRDGWYSRINLDWFKGSFEPPVIKGGPFYWYVFAIPKRNHYLSDHYLLCDYLQMREWVLDFDAPLGNDHRNNKRWRADLRLYPAEHQGYFRWGDEPPGKADRPGRVFQLDNIQTVYQEVPPGGHIGSSGGGGESAAHKLLKLYVADHPLDFGFSTKAEAHVEYPFATGDRVDVLFENHAPDRTVVEVEIEGEQNLCIGVQQAIKYRFLAAVDAGFPLMTVRVASLVIAYETNYPKAMELADRYQVSLKNVNRELVLGKAV